MFDFLKKPGKVEIKIDRMSYSFGETIRGKIILDMKKTKHAKRMELDFYAERSVPYTDRDGRRSKRTERTYLFSSDLDGERDYSGIKEYNFELKIPTQNEVKLPGGFIGKVAEVAIATAQITGMTPNPLRWFVKATLEIPGGKDASKTIQINVT